MRRGVHAAACGVMVVALVAACGNGEVTVPSVTGDAASGSVLYERNCAGCHGTDGGGADDGPGLVDARYAPPGFDDLEVVTAIVEGAAQEHGEFGAMPRIRGLSDQDLADLLAFVRSLQSDAGLG